MEDFVTLDELAEDEDECERAAESVGRCPHARVRRSLPDRLTPSLSLSADSTKKGVSRK